MASRMRLSWTAASQLATQRVVFPAGDVRRPHLARAGIADARDGDADGADPELPGAGSGQKLGQFVTDELTHRAALAAREGNGAGRESCLWE